MTQPGPTAPEVPDDPPLGAPAPKQRVELPGTQPGPEAPPDGTRGPRHPVPLALRTVASWSWRLLVVLALVTAVLLVVARLEVLFVALFVALLLSALLAPAANALRRHRVPHILATAIVLLGAIVVIVASLYLVGRSVHEQSGAFMTAMTDGVEKIRIWLADTFGTTWEQLAERLRTMLGSLGGSEGGGLASSVFGAASTALDVVSGAGIALFATIFFVHDGAGIWRWATGLFPPKARGHVDEAGRLSWQALSAYARGTVIIAAIDAIGIGVGVALVGVPLAVPIGVLVFFASFIPIVGALLSGFVAVVIALATVGLSGALIVLAIVIGVQQLEGHVLQPLIQGRMVALHPLAVVLAVAGGSIVAGLVGAVIAVPIVAVVNVIVRYTARAARGADADGRGGDPAAGDEAQLAAPGSGAEPVR